MSMLAGGMKRERMYVSALHPVSDVWEEGVVISVVHSYRWYGYISYRVRFLRDKYMAYIPREHTQRLLPL